MEIILLREVDNLGYKDDIVNVKPGYARNYLIPTHKAIVANKSNTKALEEKLRQQELKRQKMLKEFQDMAAKIESATFKIGAKVGTSGKIFGSITTIQIAESIKGQLGIESDRKKIKILEEVKSLGTFPAEIELHREVKASFSFEVVAD
jgi:large subunit ribosomal protein L9